MAIGRLFTDHPASVGETYGAHLLRAVSFGSRMIFAGCACLVHAVFPFLFVKTGSRAITELHIAMVTQRRVAPPLVAVERPRLIRGQHAPN